MRLFQLEIRNAVAQQAANAIVLLEKRHVVASACQLLRRCHTGRTSADHGDFLAGLGLGRARNHPAFGPGAVDDGVLDRLDAHRIVVDVEHAGRLAGCRADTAGELGKVVGRVQHGEGIFPVAAVHQIIEVRNDVVDGAAVVAKRCAAIHAACALLLGLPVIKTDNEFLVVLKALGYGRVTLFDALEFHEAGDFSHDVGPLFKLIHHSVGSEYVIHNPTIFTYLLCSSATKTLKLKRPPTSVCKSTLSFLSYMRKSVLAYSPQAT